MIMIHNNLNDPNFGQKNFLVDLKQMYHQCTRHSEMSNFFIPKIRTNLAKLLFHLQGQECGLKYSKN